MVAIRGGFCPGRNDRVCGDDKMSALSIGMLWQREKKTLADDIAAAAAYHKEKYGPVNTVHVNAPLTDPVWDNCILNISQDRSIFPGNIWIGWVEPRKAVENAPAK